MYGHRGRSQWTVAVDGRRTANVKKIRGVDNKHDLSSLLHYCPSSFVVKAPVKFTSTFRLATNCPIIIYVYGPISTKPQA